MRHRKRACKLGRDTSHRRCLMANMLKSLIDEERIETTLAKAKELKRHADKMITLAKKNSLASRRQATSKLMICYNSLTSKQLREVKEGNKKSYNTDRRVILKLFDTLGPRFENRAGGYTRLIQTGNRVGDKGETCIIEYLNE
ncbi:MAG: 50S ribosomal protein L17 [Chlamydiales bacterium]